MCIMREKKITPSKHNNDYSNSFNNRCFKYNVIGAFVRLKL